MQSFVILSVSAILASAQSSSSSSAPAPTTPAPTTPAPTTAAPATGSAYHVSCAGKTNGQITCIDNQHFYTCDGSGGYPANQINPCSTGSYCCPNDSNACSGRDPTCAGANIWSPPVTAAPGTGAPAAPVYAPYTPSSQYNPSAGNTGSCAGKADGRIACLSATSFGICANGALAAGAAQVCTGGTVCYESLNRCDWSNGQNPAPNAPYVPAPSTTAWSGNTGSCTGKNDGTIACHSATTFGICSGGVFSNDPPQSCPAGLVCYENLNRCDWNYSPSMTPSSPYPVPYVAPQSCSGLANNYIVCDSANTFSICSNGQPSVAQTCPLNQVCCPGLNRCDWPGCAQYVVPNNQCVGQPDNHLVCTSTTTLNYCVNGALVHAADQACPAGTVCCENLGRCDWPGCSGVPSTPTTGRYQPALPTTPYIAGSCAGIPDNHITCLDANTWQFCIGGQLLQNTNPQHCPASTVCCQGLNQCGWPGCTQAASTTLPIYSNGPSPAFCDDELHDYAHLGKFCVGERSNMWCSNGELSRINFCPSGEICCEQTGQCGIGSPVCSVPKAIPRRTRGDKGAINQCADLSDGARVCTATNTFSYCIDQTVFGPLNQKCPYGYQCCPNLGGRCEEDCNYPTTPAGDCTNQPDGATVCSGYKSFKICHNAGSLGVFDCVGDDQVCCPLTGGCTLRTQCAESSFHPIVDTSCNGLLNKRVVSSDRNFVNFCLDGKIVAKFPCNAGYDFGCDNDAARPDQSLYN